jgi:hypothetical protein
VEGNHDYRDFEIYYTIGGTDHREINMQRHEGACIRVDAEEGKSSFRSMRRRWRGRGGRSNNYSVVAADTNSKDLIII